MGIIASHLIFLVPMWVVLAAIALVALVRIFRGLQGKFSVESMLEAVVRPMLFDILPLIILALLTTIDPTHIVIRIWYYVAAVLILIHELRTLSDEFPRR